MVNEKICARVDTERKTRDDRLMVRVGKAVYYGLLDYPDSGTPLIRYRSAGTGFIRIGLGYQDIAPMERFGLAVAY